MSQPDPTTTVLETSIVGDIVMETGMFVVDYTDVNIYDMFLRKHLPFSNKFSEIQNVQCQLGGVSFAKNGVPIPIHAHHTTDFLYDGEGCNLYLRFDNGNVPNSGLVSGFYQVVGRLA